MTMNEQTPPASPAPVPVIQERASAAKLIKWGIAAVILIVAIGFAVHYWRLSERFVSTDNAYINANRIEIAAQVSGPARRPMGMNAPEARQNHQLLLNVMHWLSQAEGMPE